ncbi:MAG: hypothetical protein HZC54_21245 [Verrucomicrobia bacterium]|nr:hypothetical protein [Verrucomicrobiota bacterium]
MKTVTSVILSVAVACGAWTGRAMAAEAEVKKEPGPEVSITPVTTFVNVEGNTSKFREDQWMKQGWTGGIESFKLNQQFGKDGQFNVEGRGIYNQREYDIRMEVVKPDFGFVRAGFSQYPKYFDNIGGYYAPFSRATGPGGVPSSANTSFMLLDAPEMEIGKIFFEAGLTLPNLPKFTIGYEHQFKDGTKDLLEWGSVTGTIPAGSGFPTGDVTKKIFPAFKDIDEKVDIFKFAVEHDIGPINLGDEFYYERYSNRAFRTDDSGYFIADGTQKIVNVKEEFSHDLFSNAFHMDHHVTDKVYWSAGHLFTEMNGDSDFNIVTIPSPVGLGAGAVDDRFWTIPNINLKQDSQVGNFNVMVGPFADLTAYIGFQGEGTTTDGASFGNYRTTGTALDNRKTISSLTRKSTEETAGLRYVKIPYTTLFAEGKWIQQTYGQDVNQLAFDIPANSQAWGIDTDVTKHDYTAGFATSPWSRVNVTGQYRRYRTDNSFNTRFNTSTDYSSFIRNQEFDTDEISAKLTYRFSSRLSATLKYQLASTEINTTTGNVPGAPPPSSFVRSADYYANIYSASTTWAPLDRFYTTGMICFQDTKTTAFDNGVNSIIEYQGNVYSVIGTAGYAIDNKTDLAADYTFSQTDNFIDNGSGARPGTDYGLPLLVSNELHGLTARLTRRITENVAVALRYGFYKYNEANTGGVNNYTAHLASVSCTIRF